MRRNWIYFRLWLHLLAGTVRVGPGLLVRQMFLGRERADVYLRKRVAVWARQAARIAGARVELTGLEKIPDDKPVLYVANHQGALDIPIMMGYLPGTPGFVAKKELFAIPVFGSWMRRIGCVSLDRESARQALKSITVAARSVQAGRRLVLFPEGTRSRDAKGTIGPFKRGSLQLATKADAVVVPVTVEGSRFLLASVNPPGVAGEVSLTVGEPVDVTALGRDAVKALPETVHDVIKETLDEKFMGEIPPDAVAP